MITVLQGSAKTVWKEVLSDNNVDVAKPHDAATNNLAHTNFTSCVVKYLKKRAGFENIGNYVCRKLLNSKKPASMSADYYSRHRGQWTSMLDSGLLRMTLRHPNAAELAQSFYLGFPKAHQEKYAQANPVLGTDQGPVKTVMQQYHLKDQRDDTLKVLKQKKRFSAQLPASESRNKFRRSGHDGNHHRSGQGRGQDCRSD
jgi:hypothetical protein